MITRGRKVGVALVSALLGLSACSSVGRPLPPPETIGVRTQGPVQRAEYLIDVGDRLNIKFPYHSRFNQEVPVRPDGKISLELTGELYVAGMTAAQLTEEIKRRTSDRLKAPEVVVIVTRIGERRVYVGGEVFRPGFVTVHEGMTPLQAVVAVGGFKDTAQLDSVLYVAQVHDGGYEATRLDIENVVRNGEPETIRVRGNDIVFVPRSRVANANLFVKQYIRDMLPVDSKAGATTTYPIQ